MLKVNNLPEYAKNYTWYVCRVVDDELWFWGAFNDHDKAFETAMDVGGMVVMPSLVAEAA